MSTLQQLPILRVDFADFRLVKFDSIHEYIEQSFDNDAWDSPMSQVLGGVKSIYTFDLLAETKQPHEHFEPYFGGGEISMLFSPVLFLFYFCYYCFFYRLLLFILFLETDILSVMVLSLTILNIIRKPTPK